MKNTYGRHYGRNRRRTTEQREQERRIKKSEAGYAAYRVEEHYTGTR